MWRWLVTVPSAFGIVTGACSSAAPLPVKPGETKATARLPLPKCNGAECSSTADALLAAARELSSLRHDYLLDTTSSLGRSRSPASLAT